MRTQLGGRPTTILGLSGENVARLVAGEPILFDGRPFGCEGQVVIAYGRTEDAILAELRERGILPPSGPGRAPGPGGGATAGPSVEVDRPG